MGNSTSGAQRGATTGRPRRARNPLLRQGLSAAGRVRLLATQARLRAQGRNVR